jgi:hypothetical protein
VNSRTIVPFVIGPVLLLSGAVWAQDRQPDEVTRQLFEQYILRGGKIDTQSVMAATHLVSQRGRETGFWKDVQSFSFLLFTNRAAKTKATSPS